MQPDSLTGRRSTWPQWGEFLRQRKLEFMVAWVLEAFAPVAVLGAQLLHFSSPLFNPILSSKQIESLAEMLEDPVEARDFARFLREDITL